MKHLTLYIAGFSILLFATMCTKDVEIDFPDAEPQIVVDGQIRNGELPIVFLTRTQSFNAPIDPSSLGALFERGAAVTVYTDSDTIPLIEICADNLSPEQLEQVSTFLGVSGEDLQAIDYCLYTVDVFAGELYFGQEETDYRLEVVTSDGQVLTAETRIETPVALDSLWFEFWAGSDSLGFIYYLISDDVDERNAYRWGAQRINSYPDGEMKDQTIIYPIGSVFDDRFVNGEQEVESFYNRGNIVNSNKEDDNNEEAGFFKLNDTVVVELSSISIDTYRYLFASEDQLVNNGSPFAVPANLPSNIEGGLGLWAGYAVSLQTVICVE